MAKMSGVFVVRDFFHDVLVNCIGTLGAVNVVPGEPSSGGPDLPPWGPRDDRGMSAAGRERADTRESFENRYTPRAAAGTDDNGMIGRFA